MSLEGCDASFFQNIYPSDVQQRLHVPYFIYWGIMVRAVPPYSFRQSFFYHLLSRFSPVKKRGQTLIAMEMLGKARAFLSNSIASSTASMTVSILMSPSSISLSILRGVTPPMRSICSTFPTTSMKSCRIVSRNLTSLKSPQTGASAASTSSPCGRKLLRNWRCWVRMRLLWLGVCPSPGEAAVVCLQVCVTPFNL